MIEAMRACSESCPNNVHQRSAPHRYARILDAAYGALKHVSRSNIVIGGMTYTTGDISAQQWIENLVPTKIDLEFDFYVEPLVQAQWITDGLRIASSWSRIYAVGWIHLYDEPPESYGGLIETDGVKKPGYAAWKGG